MSFAVSAIAGTVISAGASIYGAKQGAKAIKHGADQATGENRRQYDTTREDLAPWRESGGNALQRLDRASTGDMSDFQTSPGYNFRMQEGQRAGENAFSNRGGGGNAMRALEDYRQNTASNEFGNWWNRQSDLSNQGRGATTATGQFGAQMAGQNASIYNQAGQNQASVGMYGTNQVANSLNSGLSNWLTYKGGQPQAGIQETGKPPSIGQPGYEQPRYDFQGRRIQYT